mmetsp:Transcript_50561/g.109933  ORF Transcript_50561/g.109933 Transcript_50561/m.109933 type:complete len:242 (-) Transcript_50561:753-1478(-)
MAATVASLASSSSSSSLEVSMSSSPSPSARSSSSLSSCSSCSMMSGSTKSAMLCPSMISGMMSYFHSVLLRSYNFCRSGWKTPAPPPSSMRSFSVLRLGSAAPAATAAFFACTLAGMTGGRATVSRGLGMEASRRDWTAAMAAVLPSFCPTRCSSNLSHAAALTAMTPSSVSVLISRSMAPLSSIPWMSWPSSPLRSARRRRSVLLTTMMSGLPSNRGRMLLNRPTCSLMVKPQDSETSKK